MGDRNASDKANGCGDSLVPVIIAIQPTPGVLPAAIHELLKMEGWSHHSQSRLYNALYVSTLTLEDILVIKGKTMINFSDTLICGEKYVISRIEEQLTTLALQFSTVESVQIFVNDELMEKLHDLRA